jgi:hypothetical protein
MRANILLDQGGIPPTMPLNRGAPYVRIVGPASAAVMDELGDLSLVLLAKDLRQVICTIGTRRAGR